MTNPLRIALVLGALGAASSAAAVCTPFGNPPRPLVPDLTTTTCAGGTTLGPWPDGDGTPRRACLWEPPGASSAGPLPLVVYVHPSLFTADTVPFATNLLAFLATANVSGDRSRPGFILLAPEGRATAHFYPAPDDRGTGWDNWYRQLDPAGATRVVAGVAYPENVDAATIDHFVAEETATGKVDPRRIYVTGWSNGSAMAVLWALNRPGIAAAAVYSAPNPFRAFDDPCPQTPVAGAPRGDAEIQVFNRRVPVYHLHNDCDIAGICPNGELLRSQLRRLRTPFTDVIVDATQTRVATCLAACGTSPDGDLAFADNPLGFTLGTRNHTRWPTLWTRAMLDFFRRHPLRRRR
ncbi:MAG TPA: PHB depolymerase family esterase [Candidatus Binatia bacterium]|nr:PHB depolymerase family esterase [Candidatus Binatia bacterium]